VLLWVIFAALTAFVLFTLLRPLTRGVKDDAARAAFDATVYRDQLAEVESDRERGLIGAEDAEAARIEIARRLLGTGADLRSDEPDKRQALARPIAILLTLIVPILALSLYLLDGSPRLPDQPLAARLEAPGSDRNLEALVARAEARLREYPEEGEGWEVLAPVYMGWRRYADAADAYANAIRLLGESPKRLAGYGKALVLAKEGIVSEDARKALERALALDDTLIESRILLIMAKEQDDDFAAAAEAWRGLLADAPQDAPWRQLAEQRLAQDEARATAKVDGTQDQAQNTPSESKGGPTQRDVAAAEEMSPAGRRAMIESMVQGLADRLAKQGDDLAGWLKLVRAYTVLDRKGDALKALERAKTQFSGNAQALKQLDTLAAELGLKS
jgi:cytochrome c-type biogenesis protein CcmH